MLEQLFNIVKRFGQDTVVNNPEVPNEHNQEVLADATKTIAGGFQNVMAGGGFANILDLFKGGGNNSNNKAGGGIGGLLKNPIVTMMIGYFISKLVGKYKMNPASASNVANKLIPNSINDLVTQTNDPANPHATLDNLVGSLTGGGTAQSTDQGGGGMLQNILEKFTGGGNHGNGGGFDLQDIIGGLTKKSQNNFQDQQKSGGGLMDLIKGFIK
ncbi:MAG TPA: hypothetical protein VMZ03_00850 [Chitinophagaceae bacterium]|nr:hypothetical protein [Chitinophagaceae bacterium]